MSQPPPAPKPPVSRGRPVPTAPVATVAPTRSLAPGTKLLLGKRCFTFVLFCWKSGASFVGGHLLSKNICLISVVLIVI